MIFFLFSTVILNSNDFDFLLSKGSNSSELNPRDSILERFDPILGRKSIVPTPFFNKAEPVSIAAPSSISTIHEVDSFVEKSAKIDARAPIDQPSIKAVNEFGDSDQIEKLDASEKSDQHYNESELILEPFNPILDLKPAAPTPLINETKPVSIATALSISTILEVNSSAESSTLNDSESFNSIEQSPVKTANTVNERGDNKQIEKLNTSDKYDQHISSEGDNSQASSATETYETASIGEPLKVITTIRFSQLIDAAFGHTN